jgi:hypothetical protein
MTTTFPGEREEFSVSGSSQIRETVGIDWRTALLSGRGSPVLVQGEPDRFVMLDPSLFLGDEGFEWVADTPLEERANLVVSKTFFEQVAGRFEYTAIDAELWGPLPDGESRAQLEELLAGFTMFSESDLRGDLLPEVAVIAERLREIGSQVAVELWLYLQTNSWIAARSRRIMDHFSRAGAKGIELLGNAIDDVTWLALGTRPGGAGPITAQLRQRAGINVLVAGGVAAMSTLLPWLSVPGAIVLLILSPYAKPKVNPPGT